MTFVHQHSRGIPISAWLLVGVLYLAGFDGLQTSSVAWADDNIWSVRKLNETKPWDRFVDASIRVEGRLGSSGDGQFRLLKCDARFTVDAGRLKSVPAKSTVAAAAGKAGTTGAQPFSRDEV